MKVRLPSRGNMMSHVPDSSKHSDRRNASHPRAKAVPLRSGAALVMAVYMACGIRLGAALVSPIGQGFQHLSGARLEASSSRGWIAPATTRTLAASPRRSGGGRKGWSVSRAGTLIRRQSFWDSWNAGINGGNKSSGAAAAKSKAAKEKKPRESPEPEGFPPASTLLRPDEVDYSFGGFLDDSVGNFVKNDPSLWQSLRFRLKPLGRIPLRTRVLRITLGEGAELGLVPKRQFLGAGDLDLYSCTMALKTAAHDPRIKGVLLDITGVEISMATLMEVRRAMDYFTQSGKPLWGYTESSLDTNTLNLLGGCTRRIAAPQTYVNFIGFSFPTEFYRGLFDKVGIEPQVRRIGAFKSFGDTYARDSMSEAQREVTESLLSAASGFKVGLLARDSGEKSIEDVEALYNRDTPMTAQTFKDFGLIDDVLYADQVARLLNREIDRRYEAERFGGKRTTDKNQKRKRLVDLKKLMIPAPIYLRRIRRNEVEGVPGRKGDKTIAIINAEGAIVNSAQPAQGQNNLLVGNVRQQVQAVLQDSSIEGIVVRIASPGGDALASDLMWREIRRLREAGKTVVASINSVAASGGYYIAMACETIVCDEVSITGSIGVVQAKFSLGELFEKLGVKVERISKGKYAEVLAPERGFTPEEDQYWSRAAILSYNEFVECAAMSRRMPHEDMQRRAQGRVWTGAQAKALGLVDELGGLDKALEICRDMIDLKTIAAAKRKEALRKQRKEEEKAEKERAREARKAASSASPAKDDAAAAVSLETQAIGDGEKSGAMVVASASSSGSSGGDAKAQVEDYDSDIVIPDAKMPFGPLGEVLPEDYTALDMQVVAEAKEELQKRKDKLKEKGAERLTRVKNLVPGPTGILGVLSSTLVQGGGEDLLLRRLGLVESQRAPGTSSTATLIEGLGSIASPEGCRPLAVLDDDVARMLPGISGVPKELRKLGVGPLLNTLVAKTPGLADALIEMLGKLGLSSLLD